MDPQSWRTTLFDLENQVEQNEKRVISSRAPRDRRNVKAKLPQFSHQLESLDSQLTLYSKNPVNFGLNQSELTSFISRINSVRTKLANIDALCNKSDESAKSALLGNRYNNIKDSEETIDMTNQQLFTDHQLQQANQEAQLDNISDGLTQLNDIALQQNQKLVHHNDMMQKLDETMDETNENMSHNIKRVDLVEENSRGGWISIIIMVVLLILIVFNLASDKMCPFYPGSHCK